AGGRAGEVVALEGPAPAPHPAEAQLVLDGARLRVPVYARRELRVGEPLEGPALILDDTGTLVVEPGFRCALREDGLLSLEDLGAHPGAGLGAEADPVQLELMSKRFMSIAEQMGQVLRRTAISTNI